MMVSNNKQVSMTLLLLSHFSRVQLCATPQTAAHHPAIPSPWDSPGKNTGVGCHFLLQCMKVKNESEVAQSCPTLSNPMDCRLPGSSVHGTFQEEYWNGVPLPSPKYDIRMALSRVLPKANQSKNFSVCGITGDWYMKNLAREEASKTVKRS